MKALEEKILAEGEVRPGGILKVDGFLNHRIDPTLSYAMAEEVKRLFAEEGVNKVLTIEASGIAMAVMVAWVFGCPLVFAKKSRAPVLYAREYQHRGGFQRIPRAGRSCPAD